MKLVQLLNRSQKGQGTVEYALITLAVVAIVVAVLFTNGGLGHAITGLFKTTTTSITTNATTANAIAT